MYRVSLVLKSILSLHTTPVYPGGPSEPRYTLFQKRFFCAEFGTVENLLILNSHFQGCMQLQESRLPVVCKVPCVHFFRFVLHVSAGRFDTLKRHWSMIPTRKQHAVLVDG